MTQIAISFGWRLYVQWSLKMVGAIRITLKKKKKKQAEIILAIFEKTSSKGERHTQYTLYIYMDEEAYPSESSALLTKLRQHV